VDGQRSHQRLHQESSQRQSHGTGEVLNLSLLLAHHHDPQLTDVATGLEYLHSMEVVHGDLKGVSTRRDRYIVKSDRFPVEYLHQPRSPCATGGLRSDDRSPRSECICRRDIGCGWWNYAMDGPRTFVSGRLWFVAYRADDGERCLCFRNGDTGGQTYSAHHVQSLNYILGFDWGPPLCGV
jgi:hypothetical protein